MLKLHIVIKITAFETLHELMSVLFVLNILKRMLRHAFNSDGTSCLKILHLHIKVEICN